MTHLVRQNAFTIDLVEFLQQKDEEKGQLPDIHFSRVSILPKHLFSQPFCPSIKNLNDYQVEIGSEATLLYLIQQIQKCLQENDIQVLSLTVEPPITHLKIAANIPLNYLPLLLVYLPSIKELTIQSNENLVLSSILSLKNLNRINIQDRHIFFDKGEKNLIIANPQINKTRIYLSGSRYRFFYASSQNLKFMWWFIFGNILFQLYNFFKILPQQINTEIQFQGEMSNRQDAFQKSFMRSLPFLLITTGIMIWTFLYEIEKYRARHREVIREHKIEKQH